MDVRELDVRGHDGRSVPCVFFEERRPRVAVVFPGGIRSGGRIGGAPSRPDLHYTRVLLVVLGFGVLEVWWDTETMPPEGGERWLRENALAALAAVGRERVALLVCRSLGSGVIEVLDRAWGGVPAIVLAPLRRPAAAIERRPGPTFVVVGEAEEWYDAHAVERWRAAGKEVVVLAGANHALEVEDAATSARLLADTLDAMRKWVSEAAATAAGP